MLHTCFCCKMLMYELSKRQNYKPQLFNSHFTISRYFTHRSKFLIQNTKEGEMWCVCYINTEAEMWISIALFHSFFNIYMQTNNADMFADAGCFSTKGCHDSLLSTVLSVPLSDIERLCATAFLVSSTHTDAHARTPFCRHAPCLSPAQTKHEIQTIRGCVA